tara:strand:+ start:70457 stop:70675 length:219 start_codon:yes stop_codon:yes gene_type:complete
MNTQMKSKIRLLIFALGLLLSSHLQGQKRPLGVKNIVLVYGAFADGSSWNKVIPILEKEGFMSLLFKTHFFL